MDGGEVEEMGVKITPIHLFLKRNSRGGVDGVRWVPGKRGEGKLCLGCKNKQNNKQKPSKQKIVPIHYIYMYEIIKYKIALFIVENSEVANVFAFVFTYFQGGCIL